jgi:hypothetical protein
MTEWSKDHVAAIDSLKLESWNIGGIPLNWRSDGALKWKVETVGTSKVVAPTCVS